MTPQEAQAKAFLLGLAAIKKDLDGIKEKLDGKTAVLLVEEATEGFRTYLAENRKPNTCQNYQRLLRDFEEVYAGRNVPEITAEELEIFLSARWGTCKRITLRQHVTLLKRFLGWCADFVQYKGMPAFVNQCSFIKVSGVKPPERPEFIPVSKIEEFLATFKDERHWLMVAMLLSGGLRISELIGDPRAGKLGLMKKDVAGRVLTIWGPKSGRESELAIIPSCVAEKLQSYTQELGQEDKIFRISYSSVHTLIKKHAKQVGLELTPHRLRKWCVTFWEGHGESRMSDFILRHHTTLKDRYVALSVEQIIETQDRFMKFELLS